MRDDNDEYIIIEERIRTEWRKAFERLARETTNNYDEEWAEKIKKEVKANIY